MWILVGGIAAVVAIGSLTLLTIWATSPSPPGPEVDDGET